MRLVTCDAGEGDRLGAMRGDILVDLSASGDPAHASMLALIEAGPAAWARAGDAIAAAPAIGQARLRPPLPIPPQYRDAMMHHMHIRQSMSAGAVLRARGAGDSAGVETALAARESFVAPPIHAQIPVYYKGNRFSTSGHGDDIHWPAYSQLMDFELELACVIGVGGRDIPRERAAEHIFGFTILNDFSARDTQGLEMQGGLGPAKGKDFDGANAFGPCIVTADEIGDPYALRMQARINGETWCDASSATFHWRFEDVIARVSEGETLRPGEIIGSGTVGNGCGLEHLRFLADGDIVELEIEKIGVLRNRVVRAGTGEKRI